jgi:hypothetical protein
MFDDQDRAYLAQRAATAQALASNTSDPASRNNHADMARKYHRLSKAAQPRHLIRINADKLSRRSLKTYESLSF